MDLDEALRGRRSIREYVRKAVPEGLVRQVIEAATFAPSAKNGQQWRFTVLTRDAKRELTDCFRQRARSGKDVPIASTVKPMSLETRAKT